MAFIVKIFEGLLAGNDDLQLCFYESVAKLRGAFLCHKNQANFYQTRPYGSHPSRDIMINVFQWAEKQGRRQVTTAV